MTFKEYLQTLVHVVIATLILLSLPMILCVILYNNIPDWIVCVCGVVTSLFTAYPTIRYIEWASSRLF